MTNESRRISASHSSRSLRSWPGGSDDDSGGLLTGLLLGHHAHRLQLHLPLALVQHQRTKVLRLLKHKSPSMIPY